MKNFPKSRSKDLVVQEFEKETLIYDLKTNKAFCLNEAAAGVWQQCDGQRSLAEIANALSAKYKDSVPEEFVYLALERFGKNDLLEVPLETAGKFEAMERRAMIKKIGLTTAIALPVISSIVAPTALQAASLIGLGGVCSTSPQCANGNCVPDGIFGATPACCVPGATDTIAPGITYVVCSTTMNQTICNNGASICCSNSGTMSPGACAPGFRTCRCDPFV